MDMHILDSAEELFEHGGIPNQAWWAIEIVCHQNRFYVAITSNRCFCILAEVYVIASDVYPADDISARGDADAFAFSDSKHKALRLQAPSCRSEIP